MGFFLGVAITVWIAFLVLACTGTLDNNHTDPRTHRVEVNDSTYKVCAGQNLVLVSDSSFWSNNPKVVSTTLNAPECAK